MERELSKRIRGGVVRARCSATVACLLAALVVGCAVPAAYPALEQAHVAVERARGAPRVRALAPAELDLAETALERADAAARAGAPPSQVEHLAYVASQRAAFAEARAAAQVAQAETRLLRRALHQAAVEASLENRRAPRLPRGDSHAPSLPQKDERVRAPLEEDQRERASVEDDQGVRAAEPDAAAGGVETPTQDITLNLAQLTFLEAEPTGEAVAQLTELAERLVREPGRSLLIEAEFDLPEPEARTVMERRVEVVRAFFLEQGVAPMRLVVRAGESTPAEPQATPSFGEAPN